MSETSEKESATELRETADWSIPLPAEIPRPTYMPATMAFGVTFLLWGFVTSPVLLAVGFFVMVAALVGWIGEMRRDD